MTAREYIENIPNKVAKEAIEDKQTRFHFDLSGENPTQMTLTIDNGNISVEEGIVDEAKCVISGKSQNFVNVVTGQTNAMMALMMGKVKVSNQGELMKYAKLLGII